LFSGNSTVVFCIIGVSLNQNNMNILIALGGLLFICLCFLVFYRKNFALHLFPSLHSIPLVKKSAELGKLTDKQLLLKIAMDTEQSTQQVNFIYVVTIIVLVLGVGSWLYVLFNL
jgi:hypothetical protein